MHAHLLDVDLGYRVAQGREAIYGISRHGLAAEERGAWWLVLRTCGTALHVQE